MEQKKCFKLHVCLFMDCMWSLCVMLALLLNLLKPSS